MDITSKELARICGVSIGTIDRALHDRPGISPKTKEKVLRASRELGYRPHLIARSLKTGKTMTIGVVVFDLDNQFFSQLITALEKRLRDDGYFFHLTLSDHNQRREIECLEHLVSLRADGIFLVPTNSGNHFAQFVRSLNVPVVTLDNKIPGGIPFVGIDDREAVREAMDFMFRKGYRRIVYYSPPLVYQGKENIYAVSERYGGYRDGARRLGIEPIVIKEKHAFGSIADILRDGGARTAVLCSSDMYALEVLKHLDGVGIRVPRDVGLMGFDDIDMLEYVTPPLTTISQEIDQIAAQAFAVMKRLLSGESPPGATTVKARIVERESI